MTIINFPLTKIEPNPYNARTGDPLTRASDPDHVHKIALSIAREGMLQTPVGRPNPAMNGGVQLAFGHTRLAAYALLRGVQLDIKEKDPAECEDLELALALADLGMEDFSRMPVNVIEMSDEEMYKRGIDENLARKDLTPVEEARAMLRYREDFGKTSAEIGALFNLSESAVRNKMRLLGLPEEIQSALAEGRISEGAARELLRFYDLPEEIQAKGGDDYRTYNSDWNDRKSIPNRALSGITADKVREMINDLVMGSGNNLHKARWKWDEEFPVTLDPALRWETCNDCDVKLVLEGKTYCPGFKCYQAKNEIWTRRRLAAASEACGIAAPENWHDCGKIEIPAEVRQSGCKNLRVMYEPNAFSANQKASLVPGFDDVAIVCGNRNAICTCLNGLAAREAAREKAAQARGSVSGSRQGAETAETVSEAEPAPVEKSAGPSADVLRAAAREEREAQRREVEELKRLRLEFAAKLRDAALNWNKFVWYALLNNSVYNVRFHPDQIGPIEKSLLDAAKKIAEIETTYYDRVDLERKHRNLNELLEKFGLSPLADGTLLGYAEADGTESVYGELPRL